MNNPTILRRRAARLNAIQALYEMDMVNMDTERALDGILQHRWQEANSSPLPSPERRFLKRLVNGVAQHVDDLDKAVAPKIGLARENKDIDVLVRCFLRAGAFEIFHCPRIATATIISEYVGLAHAFFAGNEPGLVNAVLDALAREVRDAPNAR